MCFEVAHAIGFSQWLMTDFHERRIHSAFGDLGGQTLKSVRGAIVKHRIFSAVQEHCPPEKPFAIRHSLLAAVSALTGGSCSRTTEI
jgi:hypothetical protein